MKFTGAWFNPAYAGEGIDIIEHADGTVIAHLFSYINKEQFWLVCSGKRVGSSAALDAWRTYGGNLGNQSALKNVQETPWGTITITEAADGKLSVLFLPLVGPSWSYLVQPIHAVDVAPPVTPPSPENVITVRHRNGSGPFYDTVAPVPGEIKDAWHWGAKQILQANVGGVWSETELTVVKGKCTITGASCHGSFAPSFTGVHQGEVLPEGTVRNIKYSMKATGAVLAPDSSGRPQADYTITSLEHGKLVNISAVIL